MEDTLIEFKKLLTIMDTLRNKCPWDMKQTFESLRYLTIEETYELTDAIIEQDYESVKGELGDIMLHIVFYAKIASELKLFDMKEVLSSINNKLIVRHPHVFGETKVETEDDVKMNWEKIKLKTGKKSVMGGVPISLPSLVKAYRIQEKAKGIGFEWENKEQVWKKVIEEVEELKAEEVSGNQEKLEEEFGDVLFALINYGRFINVNAENALEKTNKKFLRRFRQMEEIAKNQGKVFENLSLTEMDAIWEMVKKTEKY
jgi:MazG family protein